MIYCKICLGGRFNNTKDHYQHFSKKQLHTIPTKVSLNSSSLEKEPFGSNEILILQMNGAIEHIHYDGERNVPKDWINLIMLGKQTQM